jgi:hypothetical protein
MGVELDLIVREEHRYRVFKNKVLRKLLDLRRRESYRMEKIA